MRRTERRCVSQCRFFPSSSPQLTGLADFVSTSFRIAFSRNYSCHRCPLTSVSCNHSHLFFPPVAWFVCSARFGPGPTWRRVIRLLSLVVAVATSVAGVSFGVVAVSVVGLAVEPTRSDRWCCASDIFLSFFPPISLCGLSQVEVKQQLFVRVYVGNAAAGLSSRLP